MIDVAPYIEDIARRLLGAPNPKFPHRNEWRYGTKGSLAVQLTGEKRGCWYDHENEVGGGPFTFIKTYGHLDDDGARKWIADELGIKNNTPKNGSSPMICYDYVSEDGTLLFQVVRVPATPQRAKFFYQRQPDGRGGWKQKLDPKSGKLKLTMEGARMVPYHLDRLAAAKQSANGEPPRVFVCEGEKNANHVASAGFLTTTNPGGAGKWRPEYNQHFAGFDVVIFEDNDQAGRKHAQAVAASVFLVAASVRVITFRELPEKADISDWIYGGGTVEMLTAMVEQTALWVPPSSPAAVAFDDFVAYLPDHSYIYRPTGEHWRVASVNASLNPVRTGEHDKKGNAIFMSAADWLDRCQHVEQMTWCPGEPELIKNRLVIDGGWIHHPDVICFNRYRPPTIRHGDPTQAGKWIDHVHLVFPDNADYLIAWLAHRVQHPQDKINHALVLGGLQGIGKDTILEPVKHAVGPWNFAEPTPGEILGRFNSFAKSVILRISEARDLGDYDRYKFYDHMKIYCAAPPDTIRLDEKNIPVHSSFNCCGVIITTNYKTDGIYLPADDRRHYVAWSNLTKEDDVFAGDYWCDVWDWFTNARGFEHVAAYLADLDISAFNPKAPPPKTPVFWEIADAHRSSEHAEIADTIDRIAEDAATIAERKAGRPDPDFKKNPPPLPDALTIGNLIHRAVSTDLADWLRDRKNRRIIPHRIETCGYVPVRNDTAKDGLWVIDQRRQAIYAKSSLNRNAQLEAAKNLIKPPKKTN
jgi:hypothetical protein